MLGLDKAAAFFFRIDGSEPQSLQERYGQSIYAGCIAKSLALRS